MPKSSLSGEANNWQQTRRKLQIHNNITATEFEHVCLFCTSWNLNIRSGLHTSFERHDHGTDHLLNHNDYMHVSLGTKKKKEKKKKSNKQSAPSGASWYGRYGIVRLQSDRLAPLETNGWCDGDLRGQRRSLWLRLGGEPKTKRSDAPDDRAYSW